MTNNRTPRGAITTRRTELTVTYCQSSVIVRRRQSARKRLGAEAKWFYIPQRRSPCKEVEYDSNEFQRPGGNATLKDEWQTIVQAVYIIDEMLLGGLEVRDLSITRQTKYFLQP
ncbi:hypothetical protein RP20_CCG005309 [Aedes albopictus]|nr:hypothetical protein RP20_CCG005309 [Aedes albopictus]